jgi:ATP-dependent Zn protease
VAFHIDKSDPLHKATIIPRGFSLGMTVQLPEKDEQTKSKKKMMSSLAILYGGRVAEEIIFGADEITTGASSDLQKATTLATAMVTKFGLYPEVGQVFYKDVEKLSEDEKQLIDRTVKKILQNSYETAKSILLKHKDELHLLAKALLEYETLTGEEIKLVIQGEKLSK